MAKFKIQQNPTFKVTVEIPRVGAEPDKVPFEFKYRDRKVLAALFLSWQEAFKADEVRFKEMGAELTIVALTEANIEHQVSQVEALVVGWGYDVKLSQESIRALVETSAGAGDAIVKAYQGAFEAARLGN
ncbi:phage tail assembly chaperone [Pseudomonas lundensis]|uniref:phage tail assembly chaperone n=1 Tax=Pseudomonas lundensis TaxID=86185 RepID=UPI000641EADF|nr:phage tail assembly chaperone [Pseudomonas lundensis]